METKKTDIQVQEPYYSQIASGKKTVEGRLAKAQYQNLEPGDVLTINEYLEKEIVDIRPYDSFASMLKTEGLDQVLPGTSNVDKGVKIYRAFYPESLEKKFGVLAIELTNALERCLFMDQTTCPVGWAMIEANLSQ